MASPALRRISGRRKRSSSVPDLRRAIVYREVLKLKHHFIAIIGDEETGRNTIVRRFLNMSDGPFQQPEGERYTTRPILVDLQERPTIRRHEIIHLCIFIINLQQLDFENTHLTVGELKSTAVVFDVGRSSTLHTAIHCMVRITDLLGPRAPMYILIGNKIDLPQRQVSPERADHVKTICGARRYFECSALMNVDMNPVLDAILLMALYSNQWLE